ncbi:hypothetical protein DESUT3_04220 [Desulfuromonas versatilis]|uniref:Uncharacterized protein n=1 Tax=Desulfuromonas versatilis TaxID=2802975 RepID=A0ABM8HM91_9BACT|nr:hypothetical protein [Desulfuromonas versatilis]BCR03353.1 hypothetical protein DESUT3_04220 [Desulfuromonas versatilis]
MRERLIAANLWNRENAENPGQSITAAWLVLARLGAAYRYGGKTQDGRFEYLIVNPQGGTLLASGKGISIPEAMCEAALAACGSLAPGAVPAGPGAEKPRLVH